MIPRTGWELGALPGSENADSDFLVVNPRGSLIAYQYPEAANEPSGTRVFDIRSRTCRFNLPGEDVKAFDPEGTIYAAGMGKGQGLDFRRTPAKIAASSWSRPPRLCLSTV